MFLQFCKDSFLNNLAGTPIFLKRGACCIAQGPFAQARDAAQWEEKEEHADHNLRKVSPIKRKKRGLRSSTEMDFMRLRTDSYLARMHVYLTWTSKEMRMDPDVLVCPTSSTYVGMQWWCGDDVVDLPSHIPMRIWFNTSDLAQWSGLVTRIASDLGWARQKYPCTVQSIIGLRHLPPRMKNQHGLNEEKTLIGKK